ncbi:MAG: metalloregulator ArsR/SmtB family transcription factor [Pseudomonadota bacterium]
MNDQSTTHDDDIAAALEALGNATRLRIFKVLVRAGEPGLAVGEIQRRMKMAASTLSHHLQKLKTVGLVRQTRSGTTLQCHADYGVMRGVVDHLLAECCADVGCTDPHGNADCTTTATSPSHEGELT